jgi:hypothetical protein
MGASDLDNSTEFEDYKLQICSFEHSNFQTKIRNSAVAGWALLQTFELRQEGASPALLRKFDQMFIGIFTEDSP